MPRWTEEARLRQSEIQKTRQSWRYSTGPKTTAGKKASSQNALKHGMRRVSTMHFRKLLRLQSQFLKKCKVRERTERAKRRMVLDMLRQGITLEKYKEIYSSRHPDESRDPDLSAPSGFRLSPE